MLKVVCWGGVRVGEVGWGVGLVSLEREVERLLTPSECFVQFGSDFGGVDFKNEQFGSVLNNSARR
jgi:hypothetical protein